MGNFEKLSVLVIVVIVVMILVVALYTWTGDPEAGVVAGANAARETASLGPDAGEAVSARDVPSGTRSIDDTASGRSGASIVDPMWEHVPVSPVPGPTTEVATSPADDQAASPADDADAVDNTDKERVAALEDEEDDTAKERTVEVRSGDTLGHISQRAYGTTRHWRRIADRNSIRSPYLIRQGQQVVLPVIEGAATRGGTAGAATGSGRAGGTWTVRRGETIESISRAVYGTPDRWPDIFAANLDRLDDFTDLRRGMELRLP
jgi:LysM repeat protein